MASGAKSFIFNRESDWFNKSIVKNFKFENDLLCSDNSSGENGVYISDALDSMQKETVWHRLRITMSLPKDGIIKIRLYASDELDVKIPSTDKNGLEVVNLNEYLNRDDVDINRKLDTLDYIGAVKYENINDVLMYNLKGRYLWFSFETVIYTKEKVKIKSLKIEFPKVTFADYLPEVYRVNTKDNDFLYRFLGIFQSMYVDLEDKIDDTAVRFDPDKMKKDFLQWVSSWFCVKDATIWGEKKLRSLLKESVKIYKMKGTKRAVARIVEKYVGVEPIIVEQFDIKNNKYYYIQKDILEKLYGDNGFVFSVILDEKYVKTSEEYIELLRIINNVKPIDCICNLVVLNHKIYLDHHCYMGINSYIAQNHSLVLNEQSQDTDVLYISNQNMSLK